jgi:predicted Rossmann fold nucleotide-binding protein DprA/Smf involved in DNA uptake
LARQAVMPVRAVQQALVELELGGQIERQGGFGISLRPGRGPPSDAFRGRRE